MSFAVSRTWIAPALLAALVAGCAAPRAPDAPARPPDTWSGRLALEVEGRQSQSFSASFDLRGSPQQGELTLSGPFGNTVAVLQWAPQSASLNTGGQVHRFDSLDALAANATGTPLPVAALFDWLRGTSTPVSGWDVDLSQLQQGRIFARRVQPPPVAELRVALER